jgi:indole-3-glycerol phosphate synthase
VTILDDIIRDKRDELRRRRTVATGAELRTACDRLGPAREFEAALRPPRGRVSVIAEVKKASPSRGVLSATLDPVALAGTYADAGAAAISVLTDEKYFRGRLDDLIAVRAAVAVPLLRKDFTIDEYQVWEARAAGADAVLLIVAALDDAVLGDLLAVSKAAGVAALVEAHTASEVDRALAAGASIIGINNRDLKTFETRIETTIDLAPRIPPGPVVVSESGFFTATDVRRVIDVGITAVLVGEALVRAPDPRRTLGDLIGAGRTG